MFNKYSEIVKEDPNAGTLSIQDFVGPELMEKLIMCPEEDKQSLSPSVLNLKITNIMKTLKTVSAPGSLVLTNNLLKENVPFMLKVLTDLRNRMRQGADPGQHHVLHIILRMLLLSAISFTSLMEALIRANALNRTGEIDYNTDGVKDGVGFEKFTEKFVDNFLFRALVPDYNTKKGKIFFLVVKIAR